MRIEVGPLTDFTMDRCTAVADGRAVVVVTDQGVVAFPNRCLHQNSPLAGGWVRNGVLTCPLHFWRYAVDTGTMIGGAADDRLELLPIRVVDGQVHVDLPDPDAESQMPLRQRLLARAETYERESAYRVWARGNRSSTDPTDPGAP